MSHVSYRVPISVLSLGWFEEGRGGCVRNFGHEHHVCQAQKAENTDPRTNYAVNYATARGHLSKNPFANDPRSEPLTLAGLDGLAEGADRCCGSRGRRYAPRQCVMWRRRLQRLPTPCNWEGQVRAGLIRKVWVSIKFLSAKFGLTPHPRKGPKMRTNSTNQ